MELATKLQHLCRLIVIPVQVSSVAAISLFIPFGIIRIYFAATLLGFIVEIRFYKDIAATLLVFIINNAFYKDIATTRFVFAINNVFYKDIAATLFALLL